MSQLFDEVVRRWNIQDRAERMLDLLRRTMQGEPPLDEIHALLKEIDEL